MLFFYSRVFPTITATEDNDGIERISLVKLAKFSSFEPLLKPDEDLYLDEDEDIPTQETELPGQETPEIGINDPALAPTPPAADSERATTSNTITPPRFTEFLRTTRGTPNPCREIQNCGHWCPPYFCCRRSGTRIRGDERTCNRAETHELEADLSTDSLSDIGGETDGEMVQQVTITRREAIALISVLDKIPLTAMLQGKQDTIDNITLTRWYTIKSNWARWTECWPRRFCWIFLQETRGPFQVLMIDQFYGARGEGPNIHGYCYAKETSSGAIIGGGTPWQEQKPL